MRSGGGLRALLQAGGGRALYTGVWGNLAGVMPASAIFMGVYEPIKRRVADQAPPGREWLGPLIAGATAGVAASVVRVPTEVVKQRMQSGEFGGAAIGAVRAIVAREGVRGMFAGYGSFLLRDIPFDAIEFVAYEQLKRAYAATLPGGREVNAAEVSAIGALCFCGGEGEGAGAPARNRGSDLTHITHSPTQHTPSTHRRDGGRDHGRGHHALGRPENAAHDPGRVRPVQGHRRLHDQDRAGGGRRHSVPGAWVEMQREERERGGTYAHQHPPHSLLVTLRAGNRASCGSASAAASSSPPWSRPSARTRPKPRTGPHRRRPRPAGKNEGVFFFAEECGDDQRERHAK